MLCKMLGSPSTVSLSSVKDTGVSSSFGLHVLHEMLMSYHLPNWINTSLSGAFSNGRCSFRQLGVGRGHRSSPWISLFIVDKPAVGLHFQFPARLFHRHVNLARLQYGLGMRQFFLSVTTKVVPGHLTVIVGVFTEKGLFLSFLTSKKASPFKATLRRLRPNFFGYVSSLRALSQTMELSGRMTSFLLSQSGNGQHPLAERESASRSAIPAAEEALPPPNLPPTDMACGVSSPPSVQRTGWPLSGLRLCLEVRWSILYFRHLHKVLFVLFRCLYPLHQPLFSSAPMLPSR